ncbi:mucin-5B-like [Sinocyclocheilus rhinocerous]|uniref:mucin-5B-like n=1 Tax=Sinocyclocheilus rhinocerous TaxID=307959 RepID=UPI0007B9BD5D|nr:PREDICTED: mucin-5B-like [Sinocyclocheilus rhinocerous]
MGCLDPSGTPREYDERFRYNCEDCVCDRASQSVFCKPKECPDVNPEICTERGFVLVNVTNPSEPCCSKQVCHCAIDMCPSGSCTQGSCIYDAPDKTRHVLKSGEEYKYKCETVTCHRMNGSFVIEKNNTECPFLSSKDCGPGFKYEKKVGECCGTCAQVACIYDAPDKIRHVLKDGDVDNYKCETVTCHKLNGSFVTEKTKTECPYLSSFDCGPGFEYVKKDGECCGSCRQVACIYDAPDKTRHVLKDGKQYYFKCMNATCLKRNGMFMIMESYKQCPPFNPDDCVPGTVQFDKDGCCQICETSNCVLEKNVIRLHVKDCNSIEDVEVASCTGHCDDGSRYSMEKNIMMHNCSCCQEEKFSQRQVMLKCANSSEILHDYIYVESCRCTPTKCDEYTEKKNPVQSPEHFWEHPNLREKVSVPTYKNGIKIEGSPTSVKISNKHGVTVFWEEDNSLTIELPEKYKGLTCGLCGDFNGNKHDDITVSGPATWKVSTPTETCEDVTLPPIDQCDQIEILVPMRQSS